MTTTPLQDRKVVIIGGTSGIGFAVAAAAIAQDAQVVVASRRADSVVRAVAELGPRATGGPVDVREESDVAEFFRSLGPFDHLVVTSGDWDLRIAAAPADIAIADLKAALEVRLFGLIAAVKHGVGSIAPGGSITLTGGSLSHRPQASLWFGTALAGAIKHLTYGLAKDLAPIRVNAVSPGFIVNAARDERAALNPLRLESGAQGLARQPVARAGEPSEVAGAYLHLMTASYTTGQVLDVDGGVALS